MTNGIIVYSGQRRAKMFHPINFDSSNQRSHSLPVPG